MRPARLVAATVAIAALVGALALAVLPFRFEIGEGEDAIRAKGRTPILGAWSSTERTVIATWAVTDGNTGETYREARSGAEPYAAPEARKRLAGAGVGLLGGAALLVAATRRRH